MALSIKTAEADRLARTLAKLTGETMTEAVTVALRERLAREQERRNNDEDLPARLKAWSERYRAEFDTRPVTKEEWTRFGKTGMIVIDSSAIIALLEEEPLADALRSRLAMDAKRVISAATYLETGAVLAGRRISTRAEMTNFLDAFLVSADIGVIPFDAAQARIALDARIHYGRGMGHGGVLNLGDAFSYALAKSLDAPLLYIGDDFGTTDIRSALG